LRDTKKRRIQDMFTGLAMIGGMGMPELLVILAISALVFGAGRIPEIAKALGKSIKEFKKAGTEVTDDIEGTIKDESKDDS